MALHEIPEDGHKHIPGPTCPCGPKAGKTRGQQPIRTVYRHRSGARNARWAADLPTGETCCDEITFPRWPAGATEPQDVEHGPDCDNQPVSAIPYTPAPDDYDETFGGAQ